MWHYQVKIRKARALLHAGAYLCALLLAGCSTDPSPQTMQRARWLNNQGVVYMDQHNYTRAGEAFKQAIALDSVYANGYTNLGIAYYSLGQYDSAMVALHTALKYDSNHLHAHYTLGLIYNAQGNEHEKALKSFNTVLQADPDDPQVHYYLGQIKAKLEQREAAIEEFRRAIRLDPVNVSAYYAQANQLRRLGREEEWQEALATFNQLSQAGHEGISSSYQGQGKYAEAVTDPGYSDPSLDDIRGPFRFSMISPPAENLAEGLSFATFVDFDQDSDPDLLIGNDRPLMYRNDEAEFSVAHDLNFSLSDPFAIRDAVFGDWDNDGHSDLVLSGTRTLLLDNKGDGNWLARASTLDSAHRTIFADVDHDGDLDLLVLRQRGSQLLANDGTGAFTDITTQAGIDVAGPAHQAVFSDLDNDRDVDLFLLEAGSARLFTNNRDGTFSDIAGRLGLHAIDAVDLCVEDFDQDGYMDLCTIGSSGELTLYTNQKGREFTPRSLPVVSQEQVRGMRPADFDNDGDIDLLIFGSRGIHLMAQYQHRFHIQAQVLKPEDAAAQVLVADFNGDGIQDIWSDGQWWRNETEAGHWLEIGLQGLNSNRDGIGAKVEVKTANRQQKKEVRGGSQDPGTLLFGLAREDSVEFVRILWPGGVRQTELAAPAGQRIALTELDRKGTSCPILYAWDGARFRFVTDILGGAIIGYLTAPGQYNTPDTDEYVALGEIASRDGRYILQIANQLEEIIYLDAVHLLAVDHPPTVQVYPNERLLSGPPYPEFRLYPLKNLHLPRSAIDRRGQDIAAELSAIDDDWYDDFEHAPIHGYASAYSITLDLGDLSQNSHPVLLAHGWVDYAHSTSNWAAAQQGLTLYPPRVEVVDQHGNWVVSSADMGCPAGLPKHMLFDLKDVFPSRDYRLRITTNAAIYWDQFQVGTRADVPMQTHRLLSDSANLHWRGYPRHTSIKGTFAFRYHYDRLQLEADWGTHGGSFTRPGEVAELLRQVDDCYVIMFHGDELTVEFEEAALPPLQPGLERTFLLYADGFGKDMDFHSAHSLTVDPLPFHSMSSYPYPAGETYPQDEMHLDYLLEYNTRRVNGYYE